MDRGPDCPLRRELLEQHVRGAVWCDRGSVDLYPATLQMMRKLMLAQAQRCFYEKAALESMSPKLLSKVAAQVRGYVKGRIIVLQPRRITCMNVARRMSGTKKAPEPNFLGKFCRQKNLGKFWQWGIKKVGVFRVCSLMFFIMGASHPKNERK